MRLRLFFQEQVWIQRGWEGGGGGSSPHGNRLLLERNATPQKIFKGNKLQLMAVCAVGELNTGEQEWEAFSTALRGMHMTQNLIDRLSSYTSTVYDFHAGLVEVLKDSVSRALQRSSVFFTAFCTSRGRGDFHFPLPPPRNIGSPKHTPL